MKNTFHALDKHAKGNPWNLSDFETTRMKKLKQNVLSGKFS